MRKDLDSQKDYIISQLELAIPRQQLCRELKCKYDTLARRLKLWGVTLKNPSRKGYARDNQYRPASMYLSKSAPPIQSFKLKIKLLKDGIKAHQCEICNNHEWMGSPIPLELDHINGDHFDNRLENLRLLCPNCHAQLPTNSGKNIGRYKAHSNG